MQGGYMSKSVIFNKIQLNKTSIFILFLWITSLACKSSSNLPVPIELTPTMTHTTKISIMDGMEMVFIPNGIFTMGSNNGEENESPEHEIYLDNYWIDKTEVTNAMYYECVKSGGCESPLSDGFIAPKDHLTNQDRAKYPVVFVSWDNAEKYCQWVNRRLPTEAEWEKAARGSDKRIYPWGNEPPNPDLLNFNNNIGDVMPVKSFPLGASPYGVMDMAGNAVEWVADWYGYYEDSSSNNPTGPSNGNFRINRGGGFFQSDHEVRVTGRYTISPGYRESGDFGFRCAMDHIPSTTVSR